MSKILFSVIIRSFNEEKHIGRLIDGIKQQDVSGNTEIILVDSGSTDRTVSVAKLKGASVVKLQPQEFSFGRALNRGCEVAQGEFLLFASAHVYPLYKDWIELLRRPFDDPKVGLTYGKQVGNQKTKYSEHQIFAKWFPRESNQDQKTPFCNNANTMIRKAIWYNLRYNEQLTGLEDIDWAVRILAQGQHISYVSGAPVVHVHDETPQKVKNRYFREALALKQIFPGEKFNCVDYLKLLVSNIASDSLHALRDRVFFKEVRSIAIFRYMQFTGTYSGFRRKTKVTESLKRRLYYPNELQKSPDPDTIFQKCSVQREKSISY